MKKKELINLGLGQKDVLELALAAVAAAEQAGVPKTTIRRQVKNLVDRPGDFFGDEIWSGVARRWAVKLAPALAEGRKLYKPRDRAAPYRRWGSDIEPEALQQLENACALPVAVAGALMPDAHVGYGLPIGGVLATRRSVIPYAVGVDIACRVKMTIFDAPVGLIDGERDRLRKALERETRFGVGSEFRDRRQHAVIDDDWAVSPVTHKLKDKAWAQLGTSGSGNHFVEFGEVEVPAAVAPAGRGGRTLEPGRYLALLSHSGSRGTGAAVCDHYSRIAISRHEDLPGELKRLSWLELESQEGQEYWQAMNLMGRYASANHALIHRHIAKALGFEVIFDVENHHNFAWEEEHLGERLIVHRKGATPAGRGVLGIIPGSMASPAYLVRGKGQPDSLDSAAHGAGRVMSRKKAKQSFTWSETKKLLREREVELISADIDEAPMVYRDIDKVMAAQDDLVEKVARFFPRIVKMAPAGERAED